ncbi:MAG: hypothetical protein MUF28_12580 [Ignavibacterium sp.]|jgi:hypothetical protein|nr:hypothetical protein [Ignavibacterium sp.]
MKRKLAATITLFVNFVCWFFFVGLAVNLFTTPEGMALPQRAQRTQRFKKKISAAAL